MNTDDKKQPQSSQPTTANEPLQPLNNDEQKIVTPESETPVTDEGYVVVGSGLGIDE